MQLLVRLRESNHVVKLIRSFQNRANTFLLSERCATTLADIARKRLGYPAITFYIAELAQAIQSMHDLQVLHCDLKPNNIMVSMNGHVKITDFGTSKDMRLVSEYNTECGTVKYCSPEMLNGQSYSYPTDWWAFGIIVIQMEIGEHPYGSEWRSKEFCQYHSLNFPFHLIREDDGARDFVRSMLDLTPSKRSTFQDIQNHPYLRNIDWERIRNLSLEPPFIPGYINSKFFSQLGSPFVVKASTQESTMYPNFEDEIPDPPTNDFIDAQQIQQDQQDQFRPALVSYDPQEGFTPTANDVIVQEKIDAWLHQQNLRQEGRVIVSNGKIFCRFGTCRNNPPFMVQARCLIHNYVRHFNRKH